MFGRLRPPSSSLDSLELERSHSKFFKDDSLSVYEATLMKLKRGSQLATTNCCHSPMEAESDCISSISSTTSSHGSNSTVLLQNSGNSIQQPLPTLTSSASSPSTVDLKHQPSVLDLFSKYKLSHQQSISSQKDITMDIDSGNDSQS
ncbi:hypothetical protein LINGRAHAP2_LOCUS845, partial [Linum grandiflorum]